MHLKLVFSHLKVVYGVRTTPVQYSLLLVDEIQGDFMWEWLQTESSIFFSGALNIAFDVFSVSATSSPVILADNSALGLQVDAYCHCPTTSFRPSHPDLGEPKEGCGRARGSAWGRLFAWPAFFAVQPRRHNSYPTFKVMVIHHFLSCGQRYFSSIFGSCWRKTVDISQWGLVLQAKGIASISGPLFSLPLYLPQ